MEEYGLTDMQNNKTPLVGYQYHRPVKPLRYSSQKGLSKKDVIRFKERIGGIIDQRKDKILKKHNRTF